MSVTYEARWKGRPISELSREELIAAVEYLGDENRRLQTERIDRMFPNCRPCKCGGWVLGNLCGRCGGNGFGS